VIGALLGLLVAATDPCAPVTLAPSPDPESAALYRKAGDDERALGGVETAAVAYRAAAALDPKDAISRKALRELCSQAGTKADPFQAGLRQMDAHDWQAAASSFKLARQSNGDPAAALLEGICDYHLGDDAGAEPLLKLAEAWPEHQDLARFYLGLIALRAGAAPRASALFAQASANPTLGVLAADLSRLARQDARLVLTFVAQAGYDSNVSLAPAGGTSSSGSGGGMMTGGSMHGDGLYGLGASVLFRPSGSSGPYLRGEGFLRQQLQLGTYDAAGVEAAAGWQLLRGGNGLLGEYAYAYSTFGGSPYLSANRLTGAGWVTAGGLTWSARYAAQLEDYRSATLDGFSGVLHHAELRSALPVGTGGWVGIAYGASRDAANLGITSYTQHGPRLDLRLLISAHVWVGALAGVSWRAYDAYDSTIGVTRSDSYLDGAVLAEYDLGAGWSARGSLEGRRALSNAPAFEYDKLVPMIGISWQKGL
jgi:tetratricopeptide (TPR) repeat protein